MGKKKIDKINVAYLIIEISQVYTGENPAKERKKLESYVSNPFKHYKERKSKILACS